jgi:acyl-CoA reductase-like NAD-dependent aldehyde dehydrogenase
MDAAEPQDPAAPGADSPGAAPAPDASRGKTAPAEPLPQALGAQTGAQADAFAATVHASGGPDPAALAVAPAADPALAPAAPALVPPPSTEPTPLARVPEIVARARAAQQKWADLPLRDRIDAVAKVKKRILARAQEIATTLHEEVGKPIEEAALSEVLPNADLVDYWTLTIEELLDPATVELDALAYPGKVGRIHRDPRGVVALITPWNYPVSIPLRTLLPALLAGNAILFKPSEVSPRAGALVASLFKDILPEGVLELVQGAGDAAEAILDAGVDAVVFTGSVATGKRVAVACAERLIPCSMELGGKDAAIVLADCKLERTAQGLVWGAFTNAGQNCASIERVYVERSVADKLVARVVEITRNLRAGVDTGRITTQRQAAIVRRHLAEAVAAGAEVLAGGAPPEGSLEFPPTVVKLTNEDCALMTEETFGPILPIVIVDNADQAIAKTNASRFGLTTSIWTKKVRRGRELARRLKSGVVTINNHGFTAAIPAAPWTGAGDSGYGITNSPHALSELTRPRFILEDTSGAKRELWWYPYTPVLRTLAFAMARARGGAGFFGRIAAFFRLLLTIPRRMFGG